MRRSRARRAASRDLANARHLLGHERHVYPLSPAVVRHTENRILGLSDFGRSLRARRTVLHGMRVRDRGNTRITRRQVLGRRRCDLRPFRPSLVRKCDDQIAQSRRDGQRFRTLEDSSGNVGAVQLARGVSIAALTILWIVLAMPLRVWGHRANLNARGAVVSSSFVAERGGGTFTSPGRHREHVFDLIFE